MKKTANFNTRLEEYETKPWFNYEKILECQGNKLITRFQVGTNQKSGYENSITGDGLWEDNSGNQMYRDLKICGPKYNCPVSLKSLKNFKKDGIYDFYNKYHNILFSIPKKFIKYLYKEGKYYKDPKDADNDLIRFYYNTIKQIHNKLLRKQ